MLKKFHELAKNLWVVAFLLGLIMFCRVKEEFFEKKR